MIEVQLPDGTTVAFPDGTPPATIQAVVQKALPPRQVGRTAVQGATLGFGDEIEAGARALLPGSPPYREIRDEIRGDIDAYRRSRPAEALGVEVGGAAIPTAVAAMSGFGTPAAAANVSRLYRMGRLARAGAVEGGIAGAGYSEAETPAGVAADSAGGSALGSVLSPAVGAAARSVGGLAEGLINTARTALGDRASTAVQAELRRLQEGTGRSLDEVVADVMDGRIMAENRTLQGAVRAYKSKGGEAGAFVTQQVPLRRDETRRVAQEGLQGGLAPARGGTDNVFATMRADDEAMRLAEREAYAKVFGGVPEVTPEIQATLQDILQRLPEARTEVAKIYSNSRKLAPLFTTRENGALEITRLPTLEDAEIIRRALADETSKAYRAGSGTLAGGYEEAQRALRAQLDEAYPDLGAVRQDAALRRTVRDQFAEGRRVFSIPADELEVVVDGLRQQPEALRAFRAGAMDAVRNKLKRQQNIMGKMADPNRQEGAVLRILFPEQTVNSVAHRLGIAGDAEEMYNRVMFNSMTAPEQAAASQIGSRGSLQDTFRMLQGDPMALISGLQRTLARAAPGLDDQQRLQVVRVLFSQDPEFVRRALTDDTMMAELSRRAGLVAASMTEGARRAGVAQSAGLVDGYYEQMMTPPEGQQ